jgi:hypothetical protein
VSAIERLSAEDRLILWPDQVWPQDIGALGVLDGSGLLDSDGRFRIEAAKQAVEARLHLLPRFRQVLYVPRRGLGGPLWVDAPAFDLNDHVRAERLNAPVDESDLLRAVARLRRRVSTNHGHYGRCGSSPGGVINALAYSFGYIMSSRTASPAWLNLASCWMQHRAQQGHRGGRGLQSRSHRHVICSMATSSAGSQHWKVA